MFTNTIIDSDVFLEMPLSTQALYFHLGMRADDEGFVGSPKKIIRAVSCTEDDLKLLIAKGFVICFESGIIVITHWNLHNSIRKDRKKDTFFEGEKALLTLDNNKVYKLCGTIDNQMTTNCQPVVNQMSAQGKLSKDKTIDIVEQASTANISEIVSYLNLKAGTSYKPTTKATQKHISARLNEGYTVEDFKKVIDNKCKQWLSDDTMSKYLRPETLFGSKFESYLNENKQPEVRNNYSGYKEI
jgi:uncharacterized phage protein (TIGR02220 family)